MKAPLVVLLGLLAYLPLWSAGWVMEDITWVTGHVPPFSPRSLTAWTWGWTQTPLAAHLTSGVLHGVVAFLVGLYAYRLSLSLFVAWAAGAFFVVHPLTVETVMYASSRSEQIAAIGVLGACLAATLTTLWKWPLIVGAGALGILGKESAIVVLGLVPLTLWMIRQPWRDATYVAIILTLLGVELYGGFPHVANFGDFSVEVTAWDWLLMQSTAVFRILVTLVTTVGMTPDFDYDRVPMTAQIISLGWLIGLGAVVWACRSHARVVSFALGWMLIAVAPRLLVQTPTGYLSEHQFYIPLVGLLIGCAFYVREAGHRVAVYWDARSIA